MDHTMHNMVAPAAYGHEGMAMPTMPTASTSPMCNMNMLFTWDTTDLCIIFRWWHITSIITLILSLVGVALLTAGYEGVREASRQYETRNAEYVNSLPTAGDDESRSSRGLGKSSPLEKQKTKVIKALFYAAQVFYSFFIMLLFMTYNGWVMLSVAIGAFIGFLAFGGGSATKTVACH